MAKHTEILERYGKFKRENAQFLHCNYACTNVVEDFSKCVLDVKNEADILHKSKIVCTFIKCISYANGNNNGIVVAQNSSQNDLQSRNQTTKVQLSSKEAIGIHYYYRFGGIDFFAQVSGGSFFYSPMIAQ